MELLGRYGPFVLGAFVAVVLGAYTMRSSGRPGVGQSVALFVIALVIFIAADILTGQALTRPDLGWVGVAAIAVFGLAIIVAIGVLARRARPRT
jgi:hypothetical protein